ncbi:microtubule-associated Nat9 isoform X1 [Rhynchophorus ferrugineus]|uniref:microtubule-associated Nat9 isoform X1 n=1 Tax=Rhynchophorus ferrugineus TaxID=354439 RepID=UPI003FCCB379
MLINKYTVIKGRNIVLVPYREEHVLKYHEWMKSEELQKLTASEPLTLKEEYEMQKSWQKDENKCTFIVLEKDKYEQTGNEIDSMIGDTNLFFATPEDRICAEAEIMIAEQSARGKKYGWEAMLLMFLYAIKTLDVKQFVVKVSFDNTPSINMFQKMGFVELSRSQIFQEVTLSKLVDDNWKIWIELCLGKFEIIDTKSEL